MQRDEEYIAMLKNFKTLIEEKSYLLGKKKKKQSKEFKKYKQLILAEKELIKIFAKIYGTEKLQDYKILFQSEQLKSKVLALYFQTKILEDQINILKKFWNKEYYNEMKSVAKQIYNNSQDYNYYKYIGDLYVELQEIVAENPNATIDNNLFNLYKNGKKLTKNLKLSVTEKTK